jgi:hypothetical protein
MNEENSLSFSIRARLLPVLEGADELRAQINQMPQTISNRLNETISSPTFQEGISSQQMSKVNRLADFTTDNFDFQKLQEKEKDLIENYQAALSSGKLTKSQLTSYNKKFTQLGTDYSNFVNEFIPEQLGEEYFKDIDPARKEMLRASARQGAAEAVTKIPDISKKIEEINYANNYMRGMGEIENEQFQRRKNLEYDLSEGGFTKARGQRYLKGEKESIQSLEELQKTASEKFGGTEFGDRIFKTIGDDIDVAKNRMKEFAEEIEKAGKDSGNLLKNLKAAGAFTMAGIAINAGLNYWVQGKRIEAAEKTSFDFNSPMNMFTEQQKFELYKRTTERTREAELTGGIGGAAMAGVGALALGATGIGLPAAIVGGYFAGSSLLSKFAEGENISDTAEVQERLKRRQQVYEQLNGMVEGSASYDILRSRTRARLGSEAIEGSLDLGYTPQEELGMRTQFADARGKYDPKLYKEQTVFARAEGIDPNAIYGMNVSARMTGMEVGIGGLENARQIATNLYGENVSSQRIIDVLNDLKNINERMLNVNENMDTREATQIGMLPSLIFGNSPFGRMGDKGAQGLTAIDSLGKPGSLAEDAWLYQAYGGGDLNKFAERKKLGIVGSLENFNDITRQMNRDYGGNEWMIERRLHTSKDDSIPTAGLIPDIAKFIAEHPEGVTKADFEKFMNDPSFKAKSKEDYQRDAKGAVSETEANRAEQQKIMIQIGDDYRKMINKMGLDWLSTWRDLSISTGNRIILENELNSVLGESIKRFKEFFLEGGKSTKEFEDFRKREEAEQKKILGKETDSDRTSRKSLQQLEDKFKLEHSPSYDEWKDKHTPIKDAHGIPAKGFVAKEMLKQQEEFNKSPLGEKYKLSLYEGEADSGHAPGSPHYTNKAFDTRITDRATGKIIDSTKYPEEILEWDRQYASKHPELKWGGDFKRSYRNGEFVEGSDDNHWQASKYKSDQWKDLGIGIRAEKGPKLKIEVAKEFEEETIFRRNPFGKPQEILDFNQKFANEHGLKYGGSFSRTWRDGKFVAGSDNNHFQDANYNEIGQAGIERKKESAQKVITLMHREDYGMPGANHIEERAKEEFPIVRSDKLTKPTTSKNIPLLFEPDLSEIFDSKKKIASRRINLEDFAKEDMNFLKDKEKPGHRGTEIINGYFPKDKEKDNPQQPSIDYRALAAAIKDALQDIQGGSKEIIIRDRTAGGIITNQQADISSRNANSFFGGGY